MNEYIVRMPSDMPYEIKAELNAWYVNSEPIVRCRDCREYHPELYKHISCELLGRNVEPNGFCAWGVLAVCQNEHGHCSVCGAIMYDAPSYCPNCGAKVVNE